MTDARLTPAARRDLRAAAEWIAADNPAAARALRDAMGKIAKLIGKHPYMGSLRPALADPPNRFFPVTGFPYLIVYDSDYRPPLILRILHTARDLPVILRNL